jgi:hypothetical protein
MQTDKNGAGARLQRILGDIAGGRKHSLVLAVVGGSISYGVGVDAATEVSVASVNHYLSYAIKRAFSITFLLYGVGVDAATEVRVT